MQYAPSHHFQVLYETGNYGDILCISAITSSCLRSQLHVIKDEAGMAHNVTFPDKGCGLPLKTVAEICKLSNQDDKCTSSY